MESPTCPSADRGPAPGAATARASVSSEEPRKRVAVTAGRAARARAKRSATWVSASRWAAAAVCSMARAFKETTDRPAETAGARASPAARENGANGVDASLRWTEGSPAERLAGRAAAVSQLEAARVSEVAPLQEEALAVQEAPVAPVRAEAARVAAVRCARQAMPVPPASRRVAAARRTRSVAPLPRAEGSSVARPARSTEQGASGRATVVLGRRVRPVSAAPRVLAAARLAGRAAAGRAVAERVAAERVVAEAPTPAS